MPRGIYPRKGKKNLPVVHAEFPLDAIPEREPKAIVRPRIVDSVPADIVRRILDQSDRMLSMMDTIKHTNKKRGPYKKKGKGKA